MSTVTVAIPKPAPPARRPAVLPVVLPTDLTASYQRLLPMPARGVAALREHISTHYPESLQDFEDTWNATCADVYTQYRPEYIKDFIRQWWVWSAVRRNPSLVDKWEHLHTVADPASGYSPAEQESASVILSQIAHRANQLPEGH